jgi:hypothetical protein
LQKKPSKNMTIVQVECWPLNEFAGKVEAVIESAGFRVKSFEHVFLIDREVYGSEPISRWTFEVDSPRLSGVLGELSWADAVLIL